MRLSHVLLLLTSVLAGGCTSEPAERDGSRPSASAALASSPVESEPPAGEWFTERARDSGIDFVHFNGMSGRFYQPEIMAPGVAFFDYDNDGDLDAYLVQGRMLGTGTPLLPAPPGPLGDRLYRNDLEMRPDGTRVLHFTDVTKDTGITTRGYGMGVAAGDIDNDGWIDLYLPGFGTNQMFRNNGNGTFSDVS